MPSRVLQWLNEGGGSSFLDSLLKTKPTGPRLVSPGALPGAGSSLVDEWMEEEGDDFLDSLKARQPTTFDTWATDFQQETGGRRPEGLTDLQWQALRAVSPVSAVPETTRRAITVDLPPEPPEKDTSEERFKDLERQAVAATLPTPAIPETTRPKGTEFAEPAPEIEIASTRRPTPAPEPLDTPRQLARLAIKKGTAEAAESIPRGAEILASAFRERHETLAGEGTATGWEWVEKVAKKSADYFEEIGERYVEPEQLQGNFIDNPRLFSKGSWWVYNINRMLPSFAATTLAGLGAGGTVRVMGAAFKWSPPLVARLTRLGAAIGSGWMGGTQEGASVGEEIRARGGTENEALTGMAIMGLATGALNALSMDKFLRRLPDTDKARFLRFLSNGAWESGTEMAEEPVDIGTKAILSYWSEQEFQTSEEAVEQLKGALNVGGPAFLLGLLGGTGVGEIASRTGIGIPYTTTREVGEQIERLRTRPRIREDLPSDAQLAALERAARASGLKERAIRRMMKRAAVDRDAFELEYARVSPTPVTESEATAEEEIAPPFTEGLLPADARQQSLDALRARAIERGISTEKADALIEQIGYDQERYQRAWTLINEGLPPTPEGVAAETPEYGVPTSVTGPVTAEELLIEEEEEAAEEVVPVVPPPPVAPQRPTAEAITPTENQMLRLKRVRDRIGELETEEAIDDALLEVASLIDQGQLTPRVADEGLQMLRRTAEERRAQLAAIPAEEAVELEVTPEPVPEVAPTMPVAPVEAPAWRVEETEGEGGVRRFTYFAGEDQVGEARMMGTTIGDIEVYEPFRRQGHGTRILDHLKDLGGQHAVAGSEAGENLLRQGGFAPEPGRPGVYRLPEAKEPAPTPIYPLGELEGVRAPAPPAEAAPVLEPEGVAPTPEEGAPSPELTVVQEPFNAKQAYRDLKKELSDRYGISSTQLKRQITKLEPDDQTRLTDLAIHESLPTVFLNMPTEQALEILEYETGGRGEKEARQLKKSWSTIRNPKPGEALTKHGDREKLMSAMFRRNPEPTAEELSEIPGSPVPGTSEAKRDLRVVSYGELKGYVQSILNAPQADQFAWYQDYGRALLDLVGEPNIEEALGVFAVTSEQVRTTDNVASALHVMKTVRDYLQLRKGDYVAGSNEGGIPGFARYLWQNRRRADGKLMPNFKQEQADRIAAYYDDAIFRGGHKTTSYILSTLLRSKGQLTPFAINDVHMARVFGFNYRSSKKEEVFRDKAGNNIGRAAWNRLDPSERGSAKQEKVWKDNPRFPNDGNSRYGQYLGARLAEEFGLAPDQLQAILWFYGKTVLSPKAGQKGTTGEWEEAYDYVSQVVGDESILGALEGVLDKTQPVRTVFESPTIAYETPSVTISEQVAQELERVAIEQERGRAAIASTKHQALPDATPVLLLQQWGEVLDKVSDESKTKIGALTDLGIDHVLERIGGAYEGNFEYSFRLHLPYANDETSQFVAALLGDAFMQDSAIWSHPRRYTDEELADLKARGYDPNHGFLVERPNREAFTDEDVMRLKDTLAAEGFDFSVVDGNRFLELLNFPDWSGKTNEQFLEDVTRITRQVAPDAVCTQFHCVSGLIPHGDYTRTLQETRHPVWKRLAGSPDLQERILNNLYRPVEEVAERWARERGWPSPAEAYPERARGANRLTQALGRTPTEAQAPGVYAPTPLYGETEPVPTEEARAPPPETRDPLQLDLFADTDAEAERLTVEKGDVLPATTGGVRTFVQTLRTEDVNPGYIDIEGRKIDSLHEIAKISQVFRTPHREHLRLMYADRQSRKALGHEDFSSNRIDAVGSPLDAGINWDRLREIIETEGEDAATRYIESTQERNKFAWQDRLRRLAKRAPSGEVVVFLVHNHPSGQSRPSGTGRGERGDISFTKAFAPIINRMEDAVFGGHVIVDSGEFSVITGDGRWNTFDLETGDALHRGGLLSKEEYSEWAAANRANDPFYNDPEVTMPALTKWVGEEVITPFEVAVIGKELQSPENMVTLAGTSGGALQTLVQVPLNLARNKEQLANYLQNCRLKWGVQHIAAFYEGPNSRMVQLWRSLARENRLTDFAFLLPGDPIELVQSESLEWKDWQAQHGIRWEPGMDRGPVPVERVWEESHYGEGREGHTTPFDNPSTEPHHRLRVTPELSRFMKERQQRVPGGRTRYPVEETSETGEPLLSDDLLVVRAEESRYGETPPISDEEFDALLDNLFRPQDPNAPPAEAAVPVSGEAPAEAPGEAAPEISPETPSEAPGVPPRPPPGQAARSFPRTLEREGRAPGTNLYYDPLTHEEIEQAARQEVKDRGVGIVEIDLLADDVSPGAHQTALGLTVMAHRERRYSDLLAEAANTEDADERTRLEDEADLNLEQAMLVASHLGSKLTEAGQQVEAAKLITRLTPESVLFYAQRQIDKMNKARTWLSRWRKPEGKKLSQAEFERLQTLGRAAQKWSGLHERAQKMGDITNRMFRGEGLGEVELDELRRFSLDIREVLGTEFAPAEPADVPSETRKRPQKPPKGRKPSKESRIAELLTRRLTDAEARAQERLRAKGIIIGMNLDPTTMRDLTILGTARLGKAGLKFRDWSAQMMEEFGEDLRPNLRKIYMAAKRRYTAEEKRVRQVYAEAQALETLIDRVMDNYGITDETARRPVADLQQARLDAEALAYAVDQLKSMSGDAQVELAQDITQALASLEERSWLSLAPTKLSAWQYISHLFNPLTNVRNIGGNEGFYRLERMQRYLSSGIDWTYSSTFGKERVITFKRGPYRTSRAWKPLLTGHPIQAYEKSPYWSGLIKGLRYGWRGYSPAGLRTTMDLPHQFAFRGKGWMQRAYERMTSTEHEKKFNIPNYLERATGAVLRGFDYAAYQRAKLQMLGEMAELAANHFQIPAAERDAWMENWVVNADAEFVEQAHEYGRYITFQDDTYFSKMSVGAKGFLNELGVGRRQGEGFGSGREFGFGELLLKYPRTPANLFARAWDYSPLGFTNTFMEVARPVYEAVQESKNTDPEGAGPLPVDRRRLIESVSRALIGSGLSAFAVVLLKRGVLTGLPDERWKLERLLRDQTGEGPFKVNLSAIVRWVLNPQDWDLLDKREGDDLYSYNWAAPIGISIAMAVNASQALSRKAGKAELALSLPEAFFETIGGAYGAVAEMPMLRSFQELFGRGFDYQTLPRNVLRMFEETPAQMIPTLCSQIRRTIDNNPRETHDPDPLARALNRCLYKLPFLSRNLPLTYKTLGHSIPRETYQDGRNTLFHIFLNPGFASTYRVDPMLKMLLDPVEALREVDHIPRITARTLSLSPSLLNERFVPESGGETHYSESFRINLTGEDRAELQRQTAEAVTRRFEAVLAGKTRVVDAEGEETPFKDLSYRMQVKALVKELNAAGHEAKQWFRDNRLDPYLEKGYGAKRQEAMPTKDRALWVVKYRARHDALELMIPRFKREGKKKEARKLEREFRRVAATRDRLQQGLPGGSWEDYEKNYLDKEETGHWNKSYAKRLRDHAKKLIKGELE